MSRHRGTPRKQSSKSPNGQSNTAKEQGTAEIHAPVASEPTPPANDTYQPNKRWQHRIPWWKILEGLGIFSVIIYAYLTYLQWHDLRHNFVVDERPYLEVSHIEWSEDPSEPGMIVKIYIDNHGHLPSIGLTGYHSGVVGTEKMTRFYFGGNETKVFPGKDSYVVPFHMRKLTDADSKSVPKYAPEIVIAGSIKYGTGLGETDEEGFCFNYLVPVMSWLKCDLGTPAEILKERRDMEQKIR